MQSYDFDIEHWPGKKHGNAGALFRRVNVITNNPRLTQNNHNKFKNMMPRDGDLIDLIIHLNEKRFAEENNVASVLLRMERQFVLDKHGFLFQETNIGKKSISQFVVPNNLCSDLLQ